LQDTRGLSWLGGGAEKTLFPGTLGSPSASNNKVTIDFTPGDNNVPIIVFGGLGNDKSVIGNSVKLINGRIVSGIYGGYSIQGESSGNTVEIEGKDSEVVGSVFGAFSRQEESSRNKVEIKGSKVVGDVYGAYAYTKDSSKNIIKIEGGTVGNNVHGGLSGYGGALENIVEIKGGTVLGTVYGGYSYSYSNNGSATGNTVTLNGDDLTTFGGSLYGGYRSRGGGDIFTGNTLNKNNASSVPYVANFEFVNFGYMGNANIDTLNTSPVGSTQKGVVLDTGAYDIVFNGVIGGAGTLTKKGTGTLTLLGENTSFTKGLVIAILFAIKTNVWHNIID
jgi:hypothetical protein